MISCSCVLLLVFFSFLFFFNDTASTEIYTLSLHDALPILDGEVRFASAADRAAFAEELTTAITTLVGKYHDERDRKSTRLNSSHITISYAVFCLKKKKKKKKER